MLCVSVRTYGRWSFARRCWSARSPSPGAARIPLRRPRHRSPPRAHRPQPRPQTSTARESRPRMPSPRTGCRTAALTPSSASARSTRSTRATSQSSGSRGTTTSARTRGVEATPLVVDGVMYTTSAWSIVYALDAKTGRELWVYDPQVPKRWGQYACCDVVNRGVAAWNGRVYVGTLDGRLVAIDAATGKLAWEKITVDQSLPYTITGAPRVVNGKVIIGNGGAEYGVRGYVTAYDADDGRPSLAVLHGARRPGERVRGEDPRDGRDDLERRMVEGRRRRHRMGRAGVRPRAQPPLHRHRQRQPVGARHPQPRRRRQSVPLLDRRGQRGHGRVRVALPDDAARELGLHGDAAADPRESRDRRPRARA